jgi:hypothetical protein
MRLQTSAHGDEIPFIAGPSRLTSKRIIAEVPQRSHVSPPTKCRRLSSARLLGQGSRAVRIQRRTALSDASAPRSELNRRPLASWYSDAAMSGRRISRVFAQTLCRPSFSMGSRRRSKQKSKILIQWTYRRGGPQRSARMLGITLNFPWRSGKYRKMTLK